MANALQQNNTPPPPPDIPGDNGLRPPPEQSGPQPVDNGRQQVQPRPTHIQTVAAMRHLHAIIGELEKLLQIPELGKADIKSQIIEGTTKLVSDRIMTPAEAVMQLATVPTNPIQQKKWVETHFMQTVQAQSAVLDHHRVGQQGFGNYDIEDALHKPDGEIDHIDTMKSMMSSHYNG